jgi:predicted nuclease of predicted toxin-antitoxin system
MRILLDENVPVDVISVLQARGHEVESVNYLGWKGIQNGELLSRASKDFDLFITRDKDFDVERLGRYAAGKFGIVLLALPQQPGPVYAVTFTKIWPTNLNALVGKVTVLRAETLSFL